MERLVIDASYTKGGNSCGPNRFVELTAIMQRADGSGECFGVFG